MPSSPSSNPHTKAGFGRSTAASVSICSAALSAAICFALASCSGPNSDVATLHGKGASSNPQTQIEQARAMVKCLEEAGVQAELSEGGGDQADVSLAVNDSSQYSFDGESWGTTYAATETSAEEDWQAKEAVWDQMRQPYQDADGSVKQPFLFIGEEDHTEAFVKCIDQTGFTPPQYQADPAEELKQKQIVAKANAEWTECARGNGLPGIKDPDPPKVDNWETYPTVVLPSTITEAQLRALLEACPSFDRKAQEEYDKQFESPGNDPAKIPDPPAQPQISIDYPPDLNWENTDDPVLKRLTALEEILHAEQMDYWEGSSTMTMEVASPTPQSAP